MQIPESDHSWLAVLVFAVVLICVSLAFYLGPKLPFGRKKLEKPSEPRQFPTEEYRFIAKEHYQKLLSQRDKSVQSHIEYGKWLIATLIVIHGGALVAISQVGDNAVEIYSKSGAFFLIGVMSAMAAGFFAWVNFQLADVILSEQADAAMIIDHKYWNPDHKLEPWMTRTLYLSAFFGIFSWLLIGIGAFSVYQTMIGQVQECYSILAIINICW